jgi:assimilatory nitrate reductase catalytic subunit
VFPTRGWSRSLSRRVPYVPVAEKTGRPASLSSQSGRLRDQWHGMSRTGTVAQLFQNSGEPCLQMCATDLLRRGLVPGELVRVASKRGAIVIPVEASAELKPGHVFLPMHWGSASLGGEGGFGVNALTSSARCPTSQQPELKHAAVRVTKAELPWRLAAFGYAPDGDALLLRDALRPLLDVLPFASVVLMAAIGRECSFARGPRRPWNPRSWPKSTPRSDSMRQTPSPATMMRRAASADACVSTNAGLSPSVCQATRPPNRGCATGCWRDRTWRCCVRHC